MRIEPRNIVFLVEDNSKGAAEDDRPVSPTWRIRLAVELFLRRKWLQGWPSGLAKKAKSAVVKTYPIPLPAPMCIIQSRYVFALHHAKEKRQGTSLL